MDTPNRFLPKMLIALNNSVGQSDVQFTHTENLPAYFSVSAFAAASMATAGVQLANLLNGDDQSGQAEVNQRLACLWFAWSIIPSGWEIPGPWDSIAGDYRTQDGWIKLHTNAPHHRAAALRALEIGPKSVVNKASVAEAVSNWSGAALETAIVGAGGCAAQMRSLNDWQTHPQGMAVANEPLIQWTRHEGSPDNTKDHRFTESLAGLKVLDLTRVLAGPVATRFLAGFGADVLRIDPPDWEEPGVVPEVTLGKRCAGLDLKSNDDRKVFERLLASADVFVHGYRPDALDNLGYDLDYIRQLNPTLIDISLNAYGWTGPWAQRRGFDSLVQMSSGIAHHGMTAAQAEQPTPLPVQALDHATGYLMAAATLNALATKQRTNEIMSAKLSLARTGHLLAESASTDTPHEFTKLAKTDVESTIEQTSWGPARRVKFPIRLNSYKPNWRYGANKLRSTAATWA